MEKFIEHSFVIGLLAIYVVGFSFIAYDKIKNSDTKRILPTKQGMWETLVYTLFAIAVVVVIFVVGALLYGFWLLITGGTV